MSSTAMEQRRKQWLLEQRLTAPLAEASEQGGNSFHGFEEVRFLSINSNA
jgi:hypothetical protein